MNVDTTAIEFLNTTATNNLALILGIAFLALAFLCYVCILNVPDAIPRPDEEDAHGQP